MEGRPVLIKDGELKIFIDSATLVGRLNRSDSATERLLSYYDSDLFDFIRSPYDTEHESLNQITSFSRKLDTNGALTEIDIQRDAGLEQIGFRYRWQDVELIAKEILQKDSPTDEEKERILLVFIQAILGNREGHDIFVTDDEVLLKNRWWFEAHFPGGKLNIVTVEEALEIMDFFAKKKGIYLIASHGTANKGLWYLYSFRSKIPFYHVSTSMLEAFASRFIYLLMSLDEMGIQYYSGVNNDTMDNSLYHFNYFISLITGIFDSLALETKDRLQLEFENDHIPWKISLSNKTGEDFLRAVRDKNLDLRNHINAYVDFINLIYKLRELVIHREGLSKTGFKYEGADEKWEANFISINDEIAELIIRCGDKKKEYDYITEWGAHFNDVLKWHVAPYYFAQAATIVLVRFANEYLKLLGFSNFIDSLQPDDGFRKDIEHFECCRLGF